jgi:CO/xanthine dehydrogenase FAD-binding subunit
VARKAYRASGSEAALIGQLPTGPVVAEAASHAVDDHAEEVNSDLHASSDYRAHLARVLTRRALEAARTRAEAA